MAKQPKYHDKPLDKWTDVQLVNYANGVVNYFHKQAKEDRAEGDLFGGWDWPTMNAVYPDLCDAFRRVRAEAERRLEANNGLLAGVQYEKTPKGWKVKE